MKKIALFPNFLVVVVVEADDHSVDDNKISVPDKIETPEDFHVSPIQSPLPRRVPTLHRLPPLVVSTPSLVVSTPPLVRTEEEQDNQQDVEADSSEGDVDNRQSSEPSNTRSKQRHSDFVLRTLPNVVRGNQHVTWELDHRPLFIAPIRSESPRPKLTSDFTHPKKPAKLLHDLVLEQQHAERVRRVASRRDGAIIGNERVDNVRRGNNDKLITLKKKINDRNERREENRAEQERCKTANARRDSSRVQSARVGTRKKANKLKESSTEKAKRAENNLAAQKNAKAKKMAEVHKRRQQVAAQAAQNEREVR